MLYVKPGEWLLAIVTFLLWIATVRLASESKVTTEHGLRAYVYTLYQVKSMPRAAGVQHWDVEITIRNSGQTPARSVIQKSFCDIVSLPLNEANLTHTFDGELSRGDLPSQGSVVTTLRQDFTPSEIQEISGGKKLLIIFGRIDYVDVFGQRQQTSFRYESRDPQNTTMIVSGKGNEAS